LKRGKEIEREKGIHTHTHTHTHTDTHTHTHTHTYLNNPGRRKEQSRGDATETKHASDTDIERAGDL
jgi:predicted TIM-barrel fold metal-dependent hydrolase